MKILVLDCSSEVASASVFDDDSLISTTTFKGLRHAENVMTMVDDVLKIDSFSDKDAHCEIKESDFSNNELDKIDKIFVCVGPGSFTGVRVAISTAMGLSLPARLKNKNIGPIGFSSHTLFLHGVLAKNIDLEDYDFVVSLIDAKRNEFHYHIHDIFDKSDKFENENLAGKGDLKREGLIKKSEFAKFQSLGKVLLVSDYNFESDFLDSMCLGFIHNNLETSYFRLSHFIKYIEKLGTSLEELGYAVPLYARPSQAEESLCKI